MCVKAIYRRLPSQLPRCLNPLLFCYHTTGDAVPGVSGGIGFHVVSLGVDNQCRATIAENGVAVISPIHISVDDLGFGFAISVHGEVLHIAGVVAFLASEHAAYITGQVFVIDGGMVM